MPLTLSAQPPDMSAMTGERLYLESRCVRCHTIGRGRFVGPDLAGVGKRYSRDEIIGWITNPQSIYQSMGKMPVNEGYPPMPPLNVPERAAERIADYVLNFDTSAQTAEAGIIRGVAVNKTTEEKTPGVRIVLTSFMGDNPTGEKETETGPDGTFDFEGLPWDRSYTITIEFSGTQYSTDKMVFKPGEDVIDMELPLFEPSESDQNIEVAESHMILEATDRNLSVADLSIFNNTGNTVYVGGDVLEDGRRTTLKFDLPEGASNISYVHGLSPDSVVETETGIADTESVIPGQKRIVYAYTLPAEEKATVIEKTFIYPTSSFLLLVSESDNEVSVSGLTQGEPAVFENRRFLRWSGAGLKAGDQIKIELAGKPVSGLLPGEGRYGKYIVILILALVLAAGILYAALGPKKTKPEQRVEASGREKLAAERESLIDEIALLDDRYEAGNIPENEYRKQRQLKKERALEVTRRLRS